MTKTFQRAHKAEQKELRRQTILQAARARFEQDKLSQITIASIARQANLAKGSVYSYFSTKEEVFLALLIDELRDWFGSLGEVLEAYPAAQTVERVVADLIDTLRPREIMLRLLSRLFLEIEENLSLEAALDFKTWLLEASIHTGTRLERALGLAPLDSPPGALGAKYLLRLNALCTGLWPMAHPTGSTAEVLARPEFEPLRVDFWEELSAGLLALFSGDSAPHTSHHPMELPWSI